LVEETGGRGENTDPPIDILILSNMKCILNVNLFLRLLLPLLIRS
jgi:hypothetical protein